MHHLTGSIIIICITTLLILTKGEPSLLDSLITYLNNY